MDCAEEVAVLRREVGPLVGGEGHLDFDILNGKMTKRGVDIRFLDLGKIEKIGGDKVKQVIKVKNGIESEVAKKIVKAIKEAKLKVQASIQGDAVRVAGAKRDDLQAAIALLKKSITDTPLDFNNFRD